MLKLFFSIFYYELLLSIRRSHEWLYPIGFFIIVIIFFPIAFSTDTQFLQKNMAGCVWVAALFSSILSLETLFTADAEDGNLEQLALSPLPLGFLLFIKIFAQWLICEFPLILLLPLISLLFHVSFSVITVMAISLLCGTLIIIFIGALGAALTLGLKQQGTLLGLLILPLLIPVLIFSVSMVQQFQAGFSIIGIAAFMAGLCLITLLFTPIAIAAAIRIGLGD